MSTTVFTSPDTVPIVPTDLSKIQKRMRNVYGDVYSHVTGLPKGTRIYGHTVAVAASRKTMGRNSQWVTTPLCAAVSPGQMVTSVQHLLSYPFLTGVEMRSHDQCYVFHYGNVSVELHAQYSSKDKISTNPMPHLRVWICNGKMEADDSFLDFCQSGISTAESPSDWDMAQAFEEEWTVSLEGALDVGKTLQRIREATPPTTTHHFFSTDNLNSIQDAWQWLVEQKPSGPLANQWWKLAVEVCPDVAEYCWKRNGLVHSIWTLPIGEDGGCDTSRSLVRCPMHVTLVQYDKTYICMTNGVQPPVYLPLEEKEGQAILSSSVVLGATSVDLSQSISLTEEEVEKVRECLRDAKVTRPIARKI